MVCMHLKWEKKRENEYRKTLIFSMVPNTIVKNNRHFILGFYIVGWLDGWRHGSDVYFDKQKKTFFFLCLHLMTMENFPGKKNTDNSNKKRAMNVLFACFCCCRFFLALADKQTEKKSHFKCLSYRIAMKSTTTGLSKPPPMYYIEMVGLLFLSFVKFWHAFLVCSIYIFKVFFFCS